MFFLIKKLFQYQIFTQNLHVVQQTTIIIHSWKVYKKLELKY